MIRSNHLPTRGRRLQRECALCRTVLVGVSHMCPHSVERSDRLLTPHNPSRPLWSPLSLHKSTVTHSAARPPATERTRADRRDRDLDLGQGTSVDTCSAPCRRYLCALHHHLSEPPSPGYCHYCCSAFTSLQSCSPCHAFFLSILHFCLSSSLRLNFGFPCSFPPVNSS